MPDDELLRAIRREMDESPFLGEGHRKITARLRQRGICTSRKRVLGLTRGAGLLARTSQVRRRARRLHDGTITVGVPDTLWATEGSSVADGRCAIFAIVDHASGEAWLDAAPRMDRWAEADLLCEVCTERFGSVEQGRGRRAGAALRRRAVLPQHRYQAEIDHLGIARSPACHYEPETNGCVERFLGIVKEKVLWIERFETFEDLRAAVRSFSRTFNARWLLARSTRAGCSSAATIARPPKHASTLRQAAVT